MSLLMIVRRALLLLLWVFALSTSPALRAQTVVDPSGHWEGVIKAPNMDVRVEIDLARNARGEYQATFSNPGRNMKGFPLADIVVSGTSVRFALKVTSGGGTFDGTIDGATMSGDYVGSTSEGEFRLPFTLTRNGEARFEGPDKSAAIGREMVGAWDGTLDADGRRVRLALTLANKPDGTSSGTIAIPERSAFEVRVTRIAQEASRLSFDINAAGARYEGTLNAERTELVGTYHEGSVALPLNFKRRE